MGMQSEYGSPEWEATSSPSSLFINPAVRGTSVLVFLKGLGRIQWDAFYKAAFAVLMMQTSASSPSVRLTHVLCAQSPRTFPHTPQACKKPPVKMRGRTSCVLSTWRSQSSFLGVLHRSGWFWVQAVPYQCMYVTWWWLLFIPRYWYSTNGIRKWYRRVKWGWEWY